MAGVLGAFLVVFFVVVAIAQGIGHPSVPSGDVAVVQDVPDGNVPMAEFLLGKLRAALRPGTRVGFVEPDFRSPLARLAYLEATTRPNCPPR